jgi:hypothetical protein
MRLDNPTRRARATTSPRAPTHAKSAPSPTRAKRAERTHGAPPPPTRAGAERTHRAPASPPFSGYLASWLLGVPLPSPMRPNATRCDIYAKRVFSPAHLNAPNQAQLPKWQPHASFVFPSTARRCKTNPLPCEASKRMKRPPPLWYNPQPRGDTYEIDHACLCCAFGMHPGLVQ